MSTGFNVSSAITSTVNTLVQGKDYFELVKSIGEAKSKQEEDRIIAEEVD